MRVDVHAHVLPPVFLKPLLESGRYQVERGPDEAVILRDRGARFLTLTPRQLDPTDRVAELDALEIDLQLLSVPAPSVFFLEGQAAADLARRCNDELARVVEANPDRFRALATVPLTADIDTAIAELARCMDELGMPGFLVTGTVDGVPLDHPRYGPLYEEANRRGAIMFVHPSTPPGVEAMTEYALAPIVGAPLDTTLALTRLIFSNFFGRFLNIDVIAAHLGGALPYIAGELDAAWSTYPECQGIARPPSEVIERLYLETASTSEPALRLALDCVGPERVLFGSDSPQESTSIAGAVERVQRTAARRDRGKILGDNAARLLGLTAG